MRTIKVDSTTMRVLKALHAYYAQIRLVRHDWNKRRLVFSKSDGIPLSNNAINKMLRSLCVQNAVVARDSGGVIQEWVHEPRPPSYSRITASIRGARHFIRVEAVRP